MLYYSTCPWTSDSSIVIISIFSSEVLSVITVICFNTIVCCIFYLMSLGWNITIFRIERSQLTNLILVGGSLYLVQLARNYSNTQKVITFLFLIAMFLTYAIIGFITIRNTWNLKKQLNDLIPRDQIEELPEGFRQSILLKQKQIKYFLVSICILFCCW